SDQDETRFQELFKEMMDNLDEDIKRGTVQQKDSYGLS
ncbi:EsaC-like protein, partial [Staphylococcus epidermidis MC19]